MGTTSNPPAIVAMPRVNRSLPVTMSMPIKLISSPTPAIIKALIMDPLDR